MSPLAKKIFSYLLVLARNRQKTTYGNIKKLLQLPHPAVSLGAYLGEIASNLEELEQKWGEVIPQIVCLVCNQKSGRPGMGKPIHPLDNADDVFTYQKWDQVEEAITSKAISSKKTKILLEKNKNLLAEFSPNWEKNLIKSCNEIEANNDLSSYEKHVLIKTRIGQSNFRKALEKRWDKSCAVTGFKTREGLRASHIIPWHKCDKTKKLNPENGLLLRADIDALFDKYLLTFSTTGEIILSKNIHAEDKIQIPHTKQILKQLTENEKLHLIEHKKEFNRLEKSRSKQ